MAYTQRDLLITERTITALQKLIAEQEARFSTIELEPDQRNELAALVKQFREALQLQRDKHSEILLSLHANEREQQKQWGGRRINQLRSRRRWPPLP
jgi:hypothetical protein